MKRNKELLNLIPYQGSELIKTKKQYLQTYLDNNNPETYYKNGKMQCYKNCNRSVRDLYYLTRAKFKSTTLNEVCVILYDLCRDKKNFYRTIFCTNIHEVVFFTDNMHGYTNFCSDGNLNRSYLCWYDKESDSNITFRQFITIAEKSKK